MLEFKILQELKANGELLDLLKSFEYEVKQGSQLRMIKEYCEKNNYDILQNNNIGFIYKEPISKQELEKLKTNYYIFFSSKLENKKYSEQELEEYIELLQENFYKNGVINCPVVEDKFVIDHVTLIQKMKINCYQIHG